MATTTREENQSSTAGGDRELPDMTVQPTNGKLAMGGPAIHQAASLKNIRANHKRSRSNFVNLISCDTGKPGDGRTAEDDPLNVSV